jgi:hypothetical protein
MDGVDLAGYTDFVQIGRGGFGTVYRARQVSLGRDVAVKILDRVERDDESVRRFRQECSALVALGGSAHAVTVFDAGTTPDGFPYLVMEYLPGGSLQDRLRTNGPMSPRLVVAASQDIASALADAHASGVLHRDVKPSNVMIDASGRCRLADFGIASLFAAGTQTLTGLAAVTVDHSAPEDLYSLGSTMFHLLTGHPPFRHGGNTSIVSVIRRVVNEAPPDLRHFGVPEPLVEVVECLLSKSPGDRPSSAAEVHGELVRIARVIAPGSDAVVDFERTVVRAVLPSSPMFGAMNAPPRVNAPSPVGASLEPFADAKRTNETPLSMAGRGLRVAAAPENAVDAESRRRAMVVLVGVACGAVLLLAAGLTFALTRDGRESSASTADALTTRAVTTSSAGGSTTSTGLSPTTAGASSTGPSVANVTSASGSPPVSVLGATVVASTSSPTTKGVTVSIGTAVRVDAPSTDASTSASSVQTTLLSTTSSTRAVSASSTTSSSSSSSSSTSSSTTTSTSAALPLPNAPTSVSASPNDGSVTLSFVPPTIGATSVTYAVRVDGGSPRALSGPGGQITGLTNGVPYTFQVRATNASGDGPWSSPSIGVVPYGLPGAPTGAGSLVLQRTYLIIGWTASASNGSAITRYEVASDGGAFVSNGVETTFRHDGLAGGQTHNYVIRAVNARGPGPTATVTATTIPPLVPPPFIYCPGGSGVTSNVLIKTTNLIDNGTLLCASIYWQFEAPGQYVEVQVPGLAAMSPGSATLRVRYTNGYGRPSTTTVSSASLTQTVAWPVTGTWTNWVWRDIPITVGPSTRVRIAWSGPAGTLTSAGPASASSLNIDQIQITVP